MRSRLTLALVGLAVGVGFLWLAVRDVEVGSALATLRTAHAGWCVLVFLSGLVFIAAKTWRWSLMLRPILKVNFGVLQSAVYIGTAANLMILHSGEILRASLLGRRLGVAPSAVLASIAVERIFDFIAVLCLLGCVLVADARLPRALVSAGVFCLVFVVLGLFVAMVGLHRPAIVLAVGDASVSFLPHRMRGWITRQISHGLSGLASMKEPRTLLLIFVLSLVQHSVSVAAILACTAGVGDLATVTAAIAVLVLAVVGLSLPAAPAQLGTIQLAFLVGYGTSSSSPETSLAASLLYTGFLVIPLMTIGAATWALTDWSPRISGDDSTRA